MAIPRTQRRLAAILAADVVGYSRLMGADEAGALAALRALWADVFNPAVAAHNGRVFKVIGDGALVEFGSAVDAFDCALAIQRHLATADGLTLRIGVNLGDVVIEGEDVFGDGVNVAARLEPMAPHGGILVSGSVHAQIAGKIAVALVDGGELELKNIAEPVRAWSWGGAMQPQRTPPAMPDNKPGIAVLPFTNMSGDPEQEYFSDGISEDIITDLSKVSGLMVVARNSSFAYKGKSPDIRDVGRELGVTSVLEGSIRRAGNKARITAQLIDAATGGHLWAERYDRDLTDIFAVQDEVTRQIVDVLKIKLLPTDQAALAKGRVPNIAAHDLALRGRDLHMQLLLQPENPRVILEKALDFYEQAIALDPAYSLPHAGLSLLYNLEHQNQWAGLPDALNQSMRLAKKAVMLDADDAYAHLALAINSLFAGDALAGKQEAQKALALNPNFASAYGALGNAEIFLGDPLAGMPYFEIAMRLDPAYKAQTLHFVGLAQLLARQYAQAAATFRERIRQVPGTDISRVYLASALGHLGEAEAARVIWAELMAIKPAYSLDAHLGRLPWHSPADEARIRDGLAMAGLPA
jgi:adenylate cyclase